MNKYSPTFRVATTVLCEEPAIDEISINFFERNASLVEQTVEQIFCSTVREKPSNVVNSYTTENGMLFYVEQLNTKKYYLKQLIDMPNEPYNQALLRATLILPDIASNYYHACALISDIVSPLLLIYQGSTSLTQVQSMARQVEESCVVWKDLLSQRLDRLNDTLTQTSLGKVRSDL